MQEIIQSSLRDTLLASIGDFLYEEGFAKDPITKTGILEIVNLISDYHEEGRPLYPEVFVTNSLDFFKSIPNKELVIHEAPLSLGEFRRAIKLCAPLATNNWIIFIEVKGAEIKYGLVSAEMVETSPSIYNQTVGKLKIEYPDVTIAYIKNIGQKIVELSGLKKRLTISLNLQEITENSLSEVSVLSEAIVQNCDEKLRVNMSTFFEKLIDESLKIGHGNLIGVIEDNDENIAQVQALLKVNSGIYLQSPVDFEFLVRESETIKSSEASVNLRSYASIFKSMLNHDGITMITNRGRIIGFHLLIDSYINKTDVLTGGARSKAYLSMRNCNYFTCCFYKSQDGDVKIWKK